MSERLESRLGRQLADYALALDMLSRVSGGASEREVVELVLNLYMELCAPAVLLYQPVHEGHWGEPVARAPVADPADLATKVQGLADEGDWHVLPAGFVARVGHGDATVAWLLVDDLAFPQFRRDYVNLTRTIVDVIALAVRNARATEALVASEALFRDLADRSPDIIWRIAADPEPHVTYLSPAIAAVTGLDPASAARSPALLESLLPPPFIDFGDAGAARYDTRVTAVDGTDVVLEVQATLIPRGVQGICRDVTYTRAEHARIADEAKRDELTGLANRRLLTELLERAVRHSRDGGPGVEVIFLDLDDFKKVNDRYGHAAGDAVLREVGRRLQSVVRAGDIVGRWGGDEFVVLCAPQTERETSVAERIGAELSRPVPIPVGGSVRCPPSIGRARGGPGVRSADLIREADAAMYAAKVARRS